MSKKRKFVADGVFNAEVHEFFSRHLTTAGYSGLVVRRTDRKIIVSIKVVNRLEAVGKNGHKGNELQALIEKRFNMPSGSVELKFDTIAQKSLSASAQAEFLKSKLLQGAAVRSAAMTVIRSVMRNRGVKGCSVFISGKMRQQRAKRMKYKSGYLISTGAPKEEFIDTAIRHIFFKQGIMGVQVKIMLPVDKTGKNGPKNDLPDKIVIHVPKPLKADTPYEAKVTEGQE
jgi:small subunit ribosomal protein S3e